MLAGAMPASVVGQYRITGVLGRGGMGVVYAAEHTLLGRPAAVKLLLPELSRKQEIVQRFFNEARAATAIRHPGIVEVYDFGWTAEDGSAYIVMELLQGETLRARRERGAMAWGAALAVTRQIAGALGAAHAKGIVHRDLKPDNVFLVLDPEVPGGERIKLLDFGIAKLAGSAAGQNMTRTGAVIGTPTYMAPEQCRGVAVDSRADLYSLGCILFELCSGRPPFVGEGEGDVLAAHIHMPPPALGTIARGVPGEVEALVGRLLVKPPLERVQTAEEVIRQIDAVSASMSGPRTVFPHEPSAAAAPRPVFPHEPSAAAAKPLAAPAVGTIYADTTLSSAVSSHGLPARRPPRRRAAVLGIAGGALAIAAAVVAIAASGGDDGAATVAAAPNETAEAGSSEAPLPTPAPATPPSTPEARPSTPEAQPSTPEARPSTPAAPATPRAAAAEPPKQEPKLEPAKPSSPVASTEPPKQEPKLEPAKPSRPTPPPDRFDVAIDSSPRGAELWLDGKLLGKTPYRGSLPRAERLTVKLPGHHEQAITVRPGAARRSVKLVPVAHDNGVNPFD
jgi:serine/threonine-protein kinase